ncbi:MAG: cysteine dioxygenase [Flavobacteriales bacterium]
MKPILLLPQLIKELKSAKRNEYPEIVKRIKIPTEDFLKFATWDNKKYTRNCLFRNENFELLLLCWEPSQKTPIHNHNKQECWVYLVQGNMIEKRCVLNKNKQLEEDTQVEMNVEGSYYINDEIGFHSLQNNSEIKRSMSLHLYAKPIEKCLFYDEKEKCLKEIDLTYSTIRQ